MRLAPGGPRAARPFQAADGEVEFQTDGTCVNTTGGWREVRLSIFAKRPRGEPVIDLDDWDEQRLPVPTARSLRRRSAPRSLGAAVAGRGGAAGDQADRPADGPGRRGEMDLEGDREEPARCGRRAGHLPRRGALYAAARR